MNKIRDYQNKAGIMAVAQGTFHIDADNNVLTPTGQLVAAAPPPTAVTNPGGAPPQRVKRQRQGKGAASTTEATDTTDNTDAANTRSGALPRKPAGCRSRAP